MSETARIGDSRETPFFFGKEGRRKYAVLHEPIRRSTHPPLLVIHPHFEEKLWAHRVVLDFARRAADRGHVVLRFDYGGHGDSEGRFEDFGMRDLEDDVAEARSVLLERNGGGAPVPVGLRFGATLAGRLAARTGDPVVLWEPVVDATAWLRDVLRANLTFQLTQFGRVMTNRDALVRRLEAGETVVIEGYGLSGPFYSDVVASGGLAGDAFPGRCSSALVVTIGKRPPSSGGATAEEVERWRRHATVTSRHLEEAPFWTDVRWYRTASPRLVDLTLGWCAEIRATERRDAS